MGRYKDMQERDRITIVGLGWLRKVRNIGTMAFRGWLRAGEFSAWGSSVEIFRIVLKAGVIVGTEVELIMLPRVLG